MFPVLAGLIGLFGYAAFRMVNLAQISINAPAFTRQMQILARAGNLDRARKLCMAAPGAALTQVVLRILGATRMVNAQDSERRVVEVLDEAGRDEAAKQDMKLKSSRTLDFLALALAAGGIAWAATLRGSVRVPLMSGYLFDAVSVGLILSRVSKVARDALAVVSPVASAVGDAVHKGAKVSTQS